MSSLLVDPTRISHIELQQCDIATIARPVGVRLTCLSGYSWITQGSEARDLVLYPGQTVVLDRRTPVYVSALDACRLRVEAPAAQRSIRSRLGAIAMAWLRRPVSVNA